MKKSHSLLLILYLLVAAGCTVEEKLDYSSSDILPNTHRQMNSPGFWTAREPLADKIILDPAGIILFNSRVEKELKLSEGLAGTGSVYSGKELASVLAKDLKGFSERKLYSRQAVRVGRPFYRVMADLMNVEAIPPRIDARYGFVSRYADQRILPTDEILTEEPGDIDFDELQNSSLDIGAPLVILHETKDGLWVYAHSPTSPGWIKKDSIVFCGLAEFKGYLEKAPFAVVTAARADIFLDRGLTQYLDCVRMGAKFPVVSEPVPGVAGIAVPFRAQDGKFIELTAYVKRSDINFGYLEYTPRNIIQQAFKLLNAPYRWGGKDGERDCSGFLQEVFSTAGIVLPRNSSDQARTGRALGVFTEETAGEFKLRILHEQAIAGVTLLRLKGHISLYIGAYEGRPYVIHETHGYRQKMPWGGDIVREINRVVVSDLSLGDGSKKGSFLERIVSINNIE